MFAGRSYDVNKETGGKCDFRVASSAAISGIAANSVEILEPDEHFPGTSRTLGR